MTNAEYIKSMDDEQLADLLCIIGWKMEEKELCLEWLKSNHEAAEEFQTCVEQEGRKRCLNT